MFEQDRRQQWVSGAETRWRRGGRLVIRLRLTQEELVTMISSTRESVTPLRPVDKTRPSRSEGRKCPDS